jgi:hypothetical protein
MSGHPEGRKARRPAGAAGRIAYHSPSNPPGLTFGPFGNGGPTGPVSYNLRFPGQFFDQNAKLHYNHFRD